MGAILAKFRKEKSTAEVLEGLEEKITQIEKYTLNTQEQKRRIVGNFLAISIGIYVIAFIIFYFVYFPPTWQERFIYSVPLFLFPFVIFLLRRLFTWYFERKLNKNSAKLTALHAEKKRILEQVMDKETYKVAVKLLDRYGDKNTTQKFLYAMTPRAPAAGSINPPAQRTAVGQSPNAASTITNRAQDFRLRPTLSTSSLMGSPLQIAGLRNSPVAAAAGVTTGAAGQALLPRAPLPITPQRRPMGGANIVAGQELRRRTPFPIVNQQGKGVLERIVDVLIGDGPKDRFAMICKECFAHNGMALKEDFDYTTFRCAFCNALNPARKARPVAPRLPEQQFSQLKYASNSSSSSSSATDIDSENDEPVASVPKPSSEIVEPEATPIIKLTAPSSTENTPVETQRPKEIGAGDAPSEATDATDIEKEKVEEMEIVDKKESEKEKDQEEESEPQTTAMSTKVFANLQALHAVEAEELNKLQQRFAKMYSAPETDGEVQGKQVH